MGKNPNEEAHVMMLCEEAHDFRMELVGLCYGPKGDSAEERKKLCRNSCRGTFQKI